MKAIKNLIVLFLLATITYAQPSKIDTLKVKANEITVIGLRYPENLMEVPLGISKIDKMELTNLKGYNLSEPLARVPGLLIQERAGTPDVRVTIRGFGARGAGDRSNSGTSRGLKFYLNGLPLTEPDGRTSFDLVEPSIMTDIEVVRSNASAIWGNAAGGVVSFRTIPDYVTENINLQIASGSYGFQKFSLSSGYNYQNGLLSVSVNSTKFDGYRPNSNGERQLFDLSFVNKLNEKSSVNMYVGGVLNSFNIPGPITKAAFDTNYLSANPNYEKRKERRNNKLLLIGLQYENYFDENNVLDATLFANPKYLQRSERGTYRDFTRYHLGGSVSYRNQMEITSGLKNVLLLGADEQYQDGAILFYKLTSDANRSDTLQTNKKEGANIAGLFVQDEIIYNESFSLLLGLRYDNLTYYNQDFMKLNKKEEKSFTKLTPKFGLSYRFNPYNTIYFNIGSGVEVPAGNETDPDPDREKLYLINPLLEPIVSNTYELGTKNYFAFDNAIIKNLYWELAGYYIQTTNDIIPYSGGKFYLTAGKTNKIGIETFIQMNLNYGLNLSGAFTFMNSKYSEYIVDSVFYDKSKSGVYADFSDNSVAGVPDYFYNFGINYSPEFFNYITLGLSIQGVSSYWADDANKYEVPSYTIFNVKLSSSSAIWLTNYLGLNFFVALNNIADTKYSSSVFINPDLEKKTNLPYYLEPGMPRNFNFGIQLIWK